MLEKPDTIVERSAGGEMPDTHSMCRVCLVPRPPHAYDLFSIACGKRKALLSEMMAHCTTVKPHRGDGLPSIICKGCSRQLKRCYTFSALCESSERRLRRLVAQGAEVAGHHVEVKEDVVAAGQGEVKEEVNGDVKTEPEPYLEDFDNGWDADDDDMVLGDIKTKKLKEEENDEIVEDENNERVIEEKKPSKKRGRKKKCLQAVSVVESGEGDTGAAEGKLPHQCDVCGKFLSTKSNLKAHKICHTDLRPYTCADCPASFRGYSALFQHKKVHSGETPYHCEYCPKQFSRRTGLVNHVRVHTGEKLYSCEICFKNFTQSAQLSIHMKRHKGDKSFLCQDCGKGFPIRSDLKVHQRIHNGEKPYSCHLCPKTFATSGNLSIHVRIHNKEIRYHCKECSRGFVTCSAFNIHVKRHKGQRDYLCECGKTFYTSSALKQHKVVHTGEKKYQCKICERKFSQTSHLSRHFKKDHAKPNLSLLSSNHYKVVVPLQVDGVLSTIKVSNARSLRTVDSVKCESIV